MNTIIRDGEVWVAYDRIEFPTRICRTHARRLAKELRYAIGRDPKTIRHTWQADHGPARFQATMSPNNPWPVLTFHDAITIRPTTSELMRFIEKLDDHAHGRTR